MRKPKNVDFQKLSTSLSKIISSAEKLLAEEMKYLDGNLSTKERNEAIIFIEELKADIEIKKELLAEYLSRVKDWNELKKNELEDYKKNNSRIKRMAKNYMSNFKLDTDLREHLKSVYKSYNKNFTEEQEIVFHNALKIEVEMCRNFLVNA
jgi:hypothetical protein